MGMHHGFLVAATSSAGLLETLQTHCGTFQDQGPLAATDWLNLPKGVDAFHVASLDGRTYLLDSAMVLTSNPDLVVSISGELGCAIASAGAETVSGTFWLVAAENGRLRRLHWNARASLTQPLDLGETLVCERRVPLEDVDGKGLLSAIGELGFDPGPITAPISGQKYLWTDDKLPAAGDLQAQINSHSTRYMRPEGEDWTKHIKPVPRGDGGFDLQYQPPADKPKIFRRLFGR